MQTLPAVSEQLRFFEVWSANILCCRQGLAIVRVVDRPNKFWQFLDRHCFATVCMCKASHMRTLPAVSEQLRFLEVWSANILCFRQGLAIVRVVDSPTKFRQFLTGTVLLQCACARHPTCGLYQQCQSSCDSLRSGAQTSCASDKV